MARNRTKSRAPNSGGTCFANRVSSTAVITASEKLTTPYPAAAHRGYAGTSAAISAARVARKTSHQRVRSM